MKKENLAHEKESEYEEIADRAVQGIKNIADIFIGTLNNAIGGMSLRERIRESLVGMDKEGSLVPSTDGHSACLCHRRILFAE